MLKKCQIFKKRTYVRFFFLILAQILETIFCKQVTLFSLCKLFELVD